MHICATYLHIPHCEFKALSHQEQLKWLIYADEVAKAEERHYKEIKTKSDLSRAKASAPKNPGVTGIPNT